MVICRPDMEHVGRVIYPISLVALKICGKLDYADPRAEVFQLDWISQCRGPCR